MFLQLSNSFNIEYISKQTVVINLKATPASDIKITELLVIVHDTSFMGSKLHS